MSVTMVEWNTPLVFVTVLLVTFGPFAYGVVDLQANEQKPAYTTGIKTASWISPSRIQVHHNYSRVNVQNAVPLSRDAKTLLNNGNSEIHQESGSTHYAVYNGHSYGWRPKDVVTEEKILVSQNPHGHHGAIYKVKKEIKHQIEVYSQCPPQTTGQFVYQSSCNKFLNCWKGRGVVQNCPAGTLFNPKTLECDFADKVECITGLDKLVEFRPQTNVKQATCPSGFVGLIPDYTDCSKFINCNNGFTNKMDCPPGTLFDITKNVCDHPYAATCFNGQNMDVAQGVYGSAVIYSGSSSDSGDLSGQYSSWSHTQSGQYAQNQNSNQYGQGQVNQGAHGHFLSLDQLSSAQKAGSSQGISSSYSDFQGGWGQHFHDKIEGHITTGSQRPAGSYANNVQQNYSYNNPDRQGRVYEQTNQGTNTWRQDYNQNTIVQAPSQTSETFDSFGQTIERDRTQGHIPSQSSTGFSQSQFGQVSSSGGQQTITQTTKYSDFHDQVPSQTVQNTGSNSGIPSNGSTERDSIQGGHFIIYNSQNRPLGQNQGSGQNTYTQSRPGSYGVQTNANQDGIEGSSSNQDFAYSQTFGQGNYGNANSGYDPQGTHHGTYSWQIVRNTTQNGGSPTPNYYAVQNGQVSGAYVRVTGQQTPGLVIGYGRAEGSNQGAGINTGKGFGTSVIIDQSGRPKCPDGESGIYPHPLDCNKFLNCDNGRTFIQDCGPGTVFNPKIKVCDFPYNVDCGSSPVTEVYDATDYPYESSSTIRYQYPTSPSGSYDNWRQPSSSNHDDHNSHAGFNSGHKFNDWQTVDNSDDLGGSGSNNIEINRATERPKPSYTTPSILISSTRRYPASTRTYPASTRRYPITTSSSQNPDQWPRSTERANPFYTTPSIVISSTRRYPASTRIYTTSTRRTPSSQNPDQWPDQTDYEDTFGTSRNNNKPVTNDIDQNLDDNWPPPYPSTDTNADYVFEYEDGEEVTLEPENTKQDIGKAQNGCFREDYHCSPDHCILKTKVCNGIQDCSDGRDETSCKEFIGKFNYYQNARLTVLEKERWDNISASTCALICLETLKFECMSFNYRKVDNTCFLTDQNIGLSGALISYYPNDYYEMKSAVLDCTDKFKCQNKKCIEFTQVCDGVDDCGDRMDEKNCNAEDFGYSVQLSGSSKENEGRIEVTAFGRTGYICDDSFGINSANVVCKELGFNLGAADVKKNSFYGGEVGSNEVMYMMDDVFCIGNETSLMDCDFSGWGVHNCRGEEVVGVVCKTPFEKCRDSDWQCKTGKECIPLPFVCDGLLDCFDESDEDDDICKNTGQIRLANGSGDNEGRLEIKHHGVWGTVCDDDFNEDAAKVVCRSLGFRGSSIVKKDAHFGPGKGVIWLDQVSCSGSESSIEDCSHWDWGEHNCEHSEDVGISCSNVDAPIIEKHVPSGNIYDQYNISLYPDTCGFRKDNIFKFGGDVNARVVKGNLANPGEYPWQASIKLKGSGDKSSHWCGAIIISERYVLTAAHCLEGYPKGAYVVVAGDYDVNKDEGTEQNSFIEDFFVHEEYGKDHKMNNDIALVKLKGQGFRLNQDVQAICLPTADADYSQDLNCTISGFGTIKSGNSAYSKKMRAAWVPVIPKEICTMPHVYSSYVTDNMFCAGYLEGGIDACDGDSGGPLACLDNGHFTLFGIISWGQHCGYANRPGVYVKVSNYRPWIDDKIKKFS